VVVDLLEGRKSLEPYPEPLERLFSLLVVLGGLEVVELGDRNLPVVRKVWVFFTAGGGD
jgi:hypothetical protein